MTRASGAGVALVAVAFLALHLAVLPRSLEDLDSINFALGIRRFDVANHQPHPPGYPVYIALAKAAHAVVGPEAAALAGVGAIAGALSVFALFALFRRIDAQAHVAAWLGLALCVTAPLYWFTAARPLSDTAGLAAALGVQALTVSVTTVSGVALASGLAALATGIRSQVAWLTVPLLMLAIVRLPQRVRTEASARAVLAFAAGALVWAMPLVVLTGGPAAYWRALFNQGAEDLADIQMLWTRPTVRELASALSYAFVAPWAVTWMAVVVLVAAAAGVLVMLRRDRQPLWILAAAFVPYLVFDIVFQETFTTRYALPNVVPVAYLAARGLGALGTRPAVVAAAVAAAFNAQIGVASTVAYARAKAPAFRLLDDMERTARSVDERPALAMDRRLDLDLRRPIQWAGDRFPTFARRLAAPPRHEWLQAVTYWNEGASTPVWFIADPLRTDVDLIQHDRPFEYRWSLPYPMLLGGVRPNELHWYHLDPDWYVGNGWALTPESAGVSDDDRRGLRYGPIEGRVRRPVVDTGSLIIGGRNFESTPRRLRILVDGDIRQELTVAPGAFLVGDGPRPSTSNGEEAPANDRSRYARLVVEASPPSRVAVEQFDAAVTRPIFGFAAGWHEQEYNPFSGLRWRWMSERGEIQMRVPQDGQAVVLHLEGESPRQYFSRPSRLIVRAGASVLADHILSSDFSIDALVRPELIQHPVTSITLETDQFYVPADRSRRTADRRRLGLRIFTCELRKPPVSARGR